MIAAYIIENHFGNFVPHLSSIVDAGNGTHILVPEASAMTCINQCDALRTLVDNAPHGAVVFPVPVKAPTTVEFMLLSVLVEANGTRHRVV
jgi:hypothetical protein